MFASTVLASILLLPGDGMRYCSKCGNPLQPGGAYCTGCGMAVSALPPVPPVPALPSVPQSVPDNTDGRQVRQASQEQSRGSSALPSAFPPQPVASSPVAGYYGTYSANARQATPYYSPPPSFSVPLAKKTRSRLGKGTTAFLVILALLTMMSGVVLIYYTTTVRPSQFRALATATVQTILTAQGQATTTAQLQAHATAQAQTYATATAVAQARTQQNTYNAATSGTPALSSPMTGQDAGNWDIYDTTDGGGCAFTANAFHASVFTSHTYVPCFAQGTSFSNFAFQVQMTILKGDGGGLIFRANDASSKLYMLRISHAGVFSIFVYQNDTTSTPILEDTSSAIKTGHQSNLVTVIARKNTISVYINKQFAGTVNDATYSSGEVGVFASDSTAGTEVAFSDANVWAL